jgi:phosphocarrier protein
VGAASRRATIVNAKGLHARPSRRFVVEASKFDARVSIRSEGLLVSADSVLNLLECMAGPGAEIEILAEGPDAEAAVEALSALVAAGFYEDEPSK